LFEQNKVSRIESYTIILLNSIQRKISINCIQHHVNNEIILCNLSVQIFSSSSNEINIFNENQNDKINEQLKLCDYSSILNHIKRKTSML